MKQTQIQQLNWKFPFFTIWVGQAFSLIGSKITQFALVWWLTKTTGSATVLATATMVALIPEIVIGPLAGAYIDRWNRRIVMIVADGAIALFSLWLAYIFWMGSGQVWHVYLVMGLRAIGGSFHWPAMQSSTSLMVPKEHMARVAGLNQTMGGLLNIIGAPLGALLMELLPLYGVMLVDVVTASIAIIPLLFVHIPQPKRDDLDLEGRAAYPSIWADLRAGMQYVLKWPGMVILITGAMIFKIALTPAFSLMPLLVSKHFLGDATQLGWLEMVIGIGIVIGGLLLSVWGGFRRKIITSLMGLCLLGVIMFTLGLIPGDMFGLALGCCFLIGFIVPLIDGPIMAVLQITVDPQIQGRVFTLMGSLVSLTSPFSLAFAGPISDWVGLQAWYIIAGILVTATGLISFAIPALVNLENHDKGIEQQGIPSTQRKVPV